MRILALLALLVAVPAAAQTFPELHGRPVLDAANVIPNDREQALDAKLMQFERQTGRQVMVATVATLEGRTIEDYANGLFRRVKLGRHDINDGVLLLVAPKEHKTRIEVGRGLEPYLTDALSHVIIEQTMIPRFKADDYAGGIEGGVAAIVKEVAPDAITHKQEQARLDEIARQKFASGVETFFSWLLTGLMAFGGAFGAYRVATAKRRRLRSEEKQRETEAEKQRAVARAAEHQKAQAERDRITRAQAEAAARDRAERIGRETPAERASRLAAESAAAEAARRNDEDRRRRQREDEERAESRRRSSTSSDWGSSYDSSSSSSSSYSSDSSSSFSGGGGDSGGGGASGDW